MFTVHTGSSQVGLYSRPMSSSVWVLTWSPCSSFAQGSLKAFSTVFLWKKCVAKLSLIWWMKNMRLHYSLRQKFLKRIQNKSIHFNKTWKQIWLCSLQQYLQQQRYGSNLSAHQQRIKMGHTQYKITRTKEYYSVMRRMRSCHLRQHGYHAK